MSLADDLLADFEECAGEDDDSLERDISETGPTPMDISAGPFLPSMTGVNAIRQICTLRDDPKLVELMKDIDLHENRTGLDSKSKIDGAIESHPEYKLVVTANNYAVRIGEEIDKIHKFVKEQYEKRFPELASHIPNPLEYIRTVQEIGNDLENVKNNDRIAQFLPAATIMGVSVSASTTLGKALPVEKLSSVLEATQMALELNEFRIRIYTFVESRMTFIAPNLSVIVGASIAAKLMAHAGGLTALSKMPSCNVEVLGNEQRTLSGFSSGSVFRHAGVIFSSEIVQGCPPSMRRKAARLVAGKATIAARVDACHSSTDGHVGQDFRSKIEKSLEKLQEPPTVKQVKALPAPIDQPGKKRGGRAARRKKERLAMSELRKAANRMNFATISEDAYQDDLSFSTGNMHARGKIRAPQIDDKTKVRISKALQNKIKPIPGTSTSMGTNTSSLRRAVSGTQSTVAFTSMQCLEIVNPQAAAEDAGASGTATSEKYFANTSGFRSVISKNV